MTTTPHICHDTDLRARHQGSMEHCDCCGQKLKGDPRHWIELCGGGIDVAAAGTTPEDSMGFFPLGAACAKKYPQGFVYGPISAGFAEERP